MLSVEPKAEADNIFTEILIFPDNTKKESNNSLVILRFGKKKKKKKTRKRQTHRHAEFDIALGNHALRAQATD